LRRWSAWNAVNLFVSAYPTGKR